MTMRVRIAALVLLAGATLVGAACGTSSARAGSTTPTGPASTQPAANHTPTTRRVTTTTRVNPGAADQLTQYVLTQSVDAAKSIYDRTYDFTAVTPASLAPLVPNVRYAPLDQARQGVVGLLAQDEHDVFFATRSPSGRWFCITDNYTDGISYGSGSALSEVNSNGQCQQPSWAAPGF